LAATRTAGGRQLRSSWSETVGRCGRIGDNSRL